MQYNWSTILAPEESIEKEFAISQTYRKFILIACVIFGVFTAFVSFYGGLGIILLGVLYWFYLTKAKHYAFTKKRVILVDKFLGVTITSIDYTQITDVTVDQTVLDQIGGWGTLVMNTAGTHTPQMHISFVENPTDLKKILDTIRDAHPQIVQTTTQ